MAWTYADIVTKIRNITGSPSTDQITAIDINTYINNYYVFTMPFELKEQIQLDFLDFKVFPGVNVYDFTQFGGLFLTDQPGAYADGNPLIFYQDPDIFYQDFPQQYATDQLATGDGITTIFQGGLQNPPVIIGTTFITDGSQVVSDTGIRTTTETIDTGTGITAYNGILSIFPILAGSLSITDGVEIFVDNGAGLLTGNLGGTGTIAYTTGVWSITFNTAVVTGVSIVATYTVDNLIGLLTGNGNGTINYVTGAYTVNFSNPPASSAVIYGKYQGYQPNRPQGVLFFQNQFTFMPVPDQVYAIRMQGYVNPTGLVNANDTPTLPEWGALIAYGASLDIFSDRGDLDNYNRYFPILKRYENVALARTIQLYQAEQAVERF
jgi:hypothetical protein